MKIGQNILQRLTNLSSVSEFNGRPLSAVEQVLYRMQQEAAQDLSKVVKLKHFVVSLATVPNGPARFKMSDLLRTVRLDDLLLREELKLPSFSTSIGVIKEAPLSESVGIILHRAKINSMTEVNLAQQIPSTQILYNSLIDYFANGNSQEHGEHAFITAVQNKKLSEIN